MEAGANIHGGLVAVGEHGVLVTGPARSGKSSLLVSLIRAAAREGMPAALVADDRVVLSRRDGRLWGSAPAPLAGLVEISGAGLLRLPSLAETAIDLLARLEEAPERLPIDPTATIEGIDMPVVRLPFRQAPFCADVVLTLLGENAALQKI